MKRFRRWFSKDRRRVPTLTFARPVVEPLEDRTLLSASPATVALSIAQSPEAYTSFVTQEYQALLKRAPDPTGLSNWVNALEQGVSPERVEAALASSAEYIGLHGGSPGATWLTALYQDFLNRTPDQPGLNFWLSQLGQGATPFQVALGTVTSLEHEAIVITNAYQTILGRAPEPGAIAAWQTQFQKGLTLTGLEGALLASPEFYTKSGGTDQAFITALYQTEFGRTLSLSELNSWLLAMGDSLATNPSASTSLITLNLNPIDLNLLGLEVQTNQIQVNVSAQPGQGALLGNLLTDVANLLNLQGVNNALNTVLDSVVTLLNSTSLTVSGVDTTTGPLSTAPVATVPVLDLFIAPVHLNLLGALVDTSPIHLTITAHSGPGLVLGNVVADLANLFNPPLPATLDLNTLNTALQNLLNQLNTQIPGIGSSPTTPPPTPLGQDQILSLTVAPINVNLLGLVLKTTQIQVNVNAETGNANLLGNVLTTLLNTLGATPQNLSTLSSNLNALLAKVVGVLNASSLVLSSTALGSLSQVLQTLALPNLINPTGTATAPILNLAIASTDGTTPPVDVNLLGLVITTSNIQAQLIAQTGTGQVLGNLLYNVANLLNPGGSLNLLTILNQLGL